MNTTKKIWIASCSVTMLLLAGQSQAALIDRGGGLIYDDVLDVTWLQDASYAYTSGAAPWGSLNWADTMNWVSNLEYVDTVRGVVLDDWRLPTAINSPDSFGYDLSGQSSELAYMYYVNLGYAPNYTPETTDPAPTSSNYNPFINLSYRGYWTGTEGTFAGRVWHFHFHFGKQGLTSANDNLKIWAVRDGDVAALTSPSTSVPEPGTLGMFGFGLAAIAFATRRKRSAATPTAA